MTYLEEPLYIRGENCLKCREILLNVDHMDGEAVIVNVLDFVYYTWPQHQSLNWSFEKYINLR